MSGFRNLPFRIWLLGTGLGLAVCTVKLASGRSVAPVIGPYSLELLVLMLMLAVPGMGALLAALIPGKGPTGVTIRFFGRLSRRFPTPELLSVVPVPLLAALWLLRPLPVFDDPYIMAGLFWALVCLSGAWLSALELDRRRLALGRIGLALGAIVFGLLMGELLARAMMPKLIFDPRFRLRPHMRYRIEVDLPGVSKGGIVTTNRWGLRGDEPPEDWEEWTTIMAVGGSTTVNFYLADSKPWPAVLQREIRKSLPRVWVGNGGVPAQSTSSHVLFLREVVEPINLDIVLFFVGANDIEIITPHGPVGDVERLPDLGPRAWLYRQSRLYQALYVLKKVAVDKAEVVRETVDPPFDPRPIENEIPPPDDFHELMPDPDIYRDRIRRLIRTCREIGVRPVFVTQPTLYEDTPYWRSVSATSHWDAIDEPTFSAATYWLALQTLNADLIEVCTEEGVPCFDLASVMPHDSHYFYDAIHLTEEGADMIGTLVAEFMLEEVLLPE
ncbi:hypothetical protein GF402_01575 [Candidatus Fermentibacteria bacterium]|nr:hypothetical protein [Candidatus Fermentibacteria bacterium]